MAAEPTEADLRVRLLLIEPDAPPANESVEGMRFRVQEKLSLPRLHLPPVVDKPEDEWARDPGGRFAPEGGDGASESTALLEVDQVIHAESQGIGYKAVEAIAKTHRFPPGTPRSDIVSAKMPKGVDGDFSPNTDVIRLSMKPFNATRGLLHEMGHKVDWAMGTGGPPVGRLPFSVSREAYPLMRKIENSQAYGRLRDGPMRSNFHAYWGTPTELFARAYDEWIALKQGMPAPHPPKRIELGAAWSPEDFAPIAQELDRVFANHGLLKKT
jgi:hypothetical protein